MIKKLLIFFVFCFLTLSSTLIAQSNGVCGTSQEDGLAIVERLLHNRKALDNKEIELRNDVIYVPIKFHLIADDNGNGRVNENKLYEQMCKLNESYAPYDIQFFIHEGFSYFNSSVAYSTPSSNGGTFQFQAKKKIGMINVFIPQNADTGGGSLGQTLGYYSPLRDWIVVKKDQISSFNTTLVHEVGHFLSLPHPFQGWDHEVYDIEDHGNPAPTISPDGVTLTENAARTGSCKNCLVAGDRFCDTPPDYNFGFSTNGCDYGAGTKDPCGDVVDPDESLYMSYFSDECPTKFSDDQVTAMKADLTMRRNNGTINDDYVPTTTEQMTTSTELQKPANNSTTDYYNSVFFDWSSVDGAEGYLFEIDRFPGFNGQLQQFFIEDGSSKITIENLLAGATYFWRVQPYNSYYPCSGITATSSFTAGSALTSTKQIAGINEWSIEPNPVQNTNQLTVKMNTQESFQADILLYNITGQVMKQIRKQTFAIGATSHTIDLDGLNNGMYILAIQNENGVLNEKVVIQK